MTTAQNNGHLSNQSELYAVTITFIENTIRNKQNKNPQQRPLPQCRLPELLIQQAKISSIVCLKKPIWRLRFVAS